MRSFSHLPRILTLQDPVAGEGWEGVLDGSKVAPLCPQIPFIAVTKRSLQIVGEEDCLYLGVFSSMVSQWNSLSIHDSLSWDSLFF